MTPLQKDERAALTGDRIAMIRVVSALRQYRELVANLVAGRSGDGFTELRDTVSIVGEIEGDDASDTSREGGGGT